MQILLRKEKIENKLAWSLMKSLDDTSEVLLDIKGQDHDRHIQKRRSNI